jgi:hypothetical protein
VIESATEDPAQAGIIHQKVEELGFWREALSNRPESIALQSAISEAAVGAFLLMSGLYRPAFVSLRLFFELSLATVHFSSNRLELAEWVQGRRDVSWSSLIDQEHGVLSLRYADAFFPELRESVRTYNAIGAKTYRELSEYVHGNYNTWASTDRKIEFDANLHDRWATLFDSANTVVTYSLALRFLKEIGRSDLTRILEITDGSLGYIEPIRDFVRTERG